jgi:hypothetical protein
MKTNEANRRRLDILGNGDCSSEREIFAAVLKRWRQKLGYCSILATVPAILATHVSEARSDEAKNPEASVATEGTRRSKRPNMSCSTPALLKRQSEFLLPHQKGNFAMLAAALGGADNCPGQTIPGGTYTAASPYIDSGDTTGANDTVTRVYDIYYRYYNYDAFGPDQVYTFTLTGRGQAPRIEISTTSNSYQPMIYVLDSQNYERCPTGTGNHAFNMWVLSDSRWSQGNTAILSDGQVNYLPLNVPLYLFVDSATSSATGSGPYTIRMQDVTIAPPAAPNAIDSPDFFVRQHYLDFLNRQADDSGLAFWTNGITSCGTDQACIEARRVSVSAAFFHSIEFQETGYLVYRFYKASYGNLPGLPVPIRLSEFLPDSQTIGQGVVVNQSGWQQVLETNKQAFALAFVQRSRFSSAFPSSLSPSEFVERLFLNAGVTPFANEWNEAVAEFGGAGNSADLTARARALRRVAESSTLTQQEFRRAFVLMQYFGYLRRNPNDPPDSDFTGFNFWLNKLDTFNGDYNAAEMVKAFILSNEYRQRF